MARPLLKAELQGVVERLRSQKRQAFKRTGKLRKRPQHILQGDDIVVVKRVGLVEDWTRGAV